MIDSGVFIGEVELKNRWLKSIQEQLEDCGLTMPDSNNANPVYRGRTGFHSEYLVPLLEEMGEVLRTNPVAEW